MKKEKEKVRYILSIQVDNNVYYSTARETDGISYNNHIKNTSSIIQKGEPFRLDTPEGTHLFGREVLAKAVISFIIIE